MTFTFLYLVPLWLSLSIASVQPAKGWRGLVPLHSTKSDVEKLLGRSHRGDYAVTYHVNGEVVSIEYSSCRCCKPIEDRFNIPNYTIVRIRVSAAVKRHIAALNLDKSKFRKEQNPHLPDYWYYVNAEEGIIYEVLNDDLVITTEYGASEKDYKSLKCTSAAK